MPMRLLDLPPEILTLILYSLDLPALTSCLATNRRVKSLIDDSALLQYRLAALAACVEDNPFNAMTSAQKLAFLGGRQTATSLGIVELDANTLEEREYALSGYVFATMERNAKVLDWLSLAVAIEPPVFQRLEFPGYIQCFAFAVPEEDLLVVLLSSEPVEGEMLASAVAFELRFYEMSTQSAHRKAREPVIRPPMLDGPELKDLIFRVDICESRVSLVVDSHSWCQLLIYDWKSGLLLMSLADYSTAVFLSPNVLLLAQLTTKTFELWDIGIAAGPNVVLRLPMNPKNYLVQKIQSDPKGYGSPASEPFYPSFADSIVAFQILFPSGDGDMFSGVKPLLLVVSRRALLNLLLPAEEHGKELPWREWGPDIARWLQEDPNVTTSNSYGQQWGFLGAAGEIHLVDFNPYAYRKMLGRTQGDDTRETPLQVPSVNRVVDELDRFGEEVRTKLRYLVANLLEASWYDSILLSNHWIVGIKVS
ncbi:hypothetical protein C8R46DRAFT_1064151 [Mycena filopes]|nr:hypothetical protein C8R46DRAFT_1064151 [Mycena filopes]